MLVEKDKIIELINRLFISTDNRDWSEVKIRIRGYLSAVTIFI